MEGVTRTLEVLEQLVAFPSVSADSNLPIIDYIERFLKNCGARVHRIPDGTGQKAGILATLGPDGAGVMLSGHTDVVPVTGQTWTKPAFALSRESSRVYGRGTTDMKGFVACAMAAMERAAHLRLREPLKLCFSYDEEIGCIGVRDMIGHVQHTIGLPRACIVGEPTSMQIATGHKGKVALTALCHGQAGHSAMAPQFVNALHLATDFVVHLRALQADLAANGSRDPAYGVPYSTIHVGQMSGGTALNIVPDLAEVRFEIRHLATDATSALIARAKDAALQVENTYKQKFPNARIEITQVNAYPGLDTKPGADVVAYGCALAGGTDLTKVSFGTEAGYFDGLGIPTIVCGPGSMDHQGHQPDEYLEMSQIAACDTMMDRLLTDLSAPDQQR